MRKISSPEAMIELGQELAWNHKILLLEWELGAGKTLLAKWFARWLWLDDHEVQSPTYAYLKSHEGKLLHIDMYRLETFEDIVEKGVLAQIHEHEHIVIERPKYIEQLWLQEYTHIHITKISEDEREVEITKYPTE